jgi:hypothetical protein
MDLKYSVDWIHLAQDRIQWRAVLNMNVQLINGRKFREQLNDY